MKKILLLISLCPLFSFGASFDNRLSGSDSPKVSDTNYGKCYIYDDLAVLSRLTNDVVGEEILVKDDDLTCEWNLDHGWLVDSGEASYFIGKWHNWLFIDRGTGVDFRDIVIYNMQTQALAYSDTYATPVKIKSDSLKYWQNIPTLANKDNCDKYNQANENGLSLQMQQLVSVDLSNNLLKMTTQSDYRCVFIQ